MGSRRLAQEGTPPGRRARKATGRRTRRSRFPRSDWVFSFPAFSRPFTPTHATDWLSNRTALSRRREDSVSCNLVCGLSFRPLIFPLVGRSARTEHEEKEEPWGLFFAQQADAVEWW